MTVYKITEPHEDGRTHTTVHEDYEGEATDLFLAADSDANEVVDVLYCIDTNSEDQIELWRSDWISTKETK